MAAIHRRVLTPEQIEQNRSVGVGLKYLLMFSVSELVDQEGVCHIIEGSTRTNYCYVMFEASQHDDYSYLFENPTFVTLNEANFGNPSIDIRGIRIGLNGQLVSAGQGFTHIDTSITGASYVSGGQSLLDPATDTSDGRLGTTFAIQQGAAQDMFFLAFEHFNGEDGVVTTAIQPPIAFGYSLTGEATSNIGVRTFEAVSESFAQITGIPSASSEVQELFRGSGELQRKLPVSGDLKSYQSSHQTALAQLAMTYCDLLVEREAALANSVFFEDGGSSFDFTVRADLIAEASWENEVIDPLLEAALVRGGADAAYLGSQPDLATARSTLSTLVNSNVDELPRPYNPNNSAYEFVSDGKLDGLKYCKTADPMDGSCAAFPDRTKDVVKAVCAGVLGSAAVMLQ